MIHRLEYLHRSSRALTGILVAFFAITASANSPPAVKDGDIIFHTSRSSQSVAIQRATHSKYSHMGIVFVRNGAPFVLEASSTVKYTPLKEWIARGKDSKYVLRRLRTPPTMEQVEKLRKAAGPLIGKRYDLTFEWSDSRIYCSELVWKIYQRGLGLRIGELQQLKEFDLTDSAVRAKMKERYGKAIPLDETVVSPAAMFEATILVEVGT
jgi:uncharacterized protein YycO